MAHLPTLKQLKYLCSLAQHKHFGQAARACHVSQSTLSAGILELEETLAVSLIERHHKGPIITLIGQEVIARSKDILRNVDDLMLLCENQCNPFQGKLRLGVIPTIAPFLLPDLLHHLRLDHPQLKMYIREDLSAHLVERLDEGELDLLLLALPYPADHTETMHLFYDDFILACPKAHPLNSATHLQTDDLQKYDLLLLEDGHCLRDHAIQSCRLDESRIKNPFQASSLTTIVQMVACDIGITLIPRIAEQANITQGTSIVLNEFTQPGVHRSIGLMWRKKTPRKNDFIAIGDYFKTYFSSAKRTE